MKSVSSKVMLCAVSFVLAFSLAACTSQETVSSSTEESQVTESTQQEESETASATSQTDSTSESIYDTQEFVDKYNAYVDVNNLMMDRVNTVINSYFRRVVPQEAFQMQDGTTDFWCNSFGDSSFNIVESAYEYMSKEPELGTLDESYGELYDVMLPMMETFSEIYQYGELKKYADDDYAGAAELHAKLWPLYNSYVTVGDKFITELWAVQEEQNARMLELFKQEGYEAHYIYNCLIDKGQEIQDAIYMQGIYDDNITELDIAALQPLYDEFAALVDQSLAVTEEQVAMEGGAEYLKGMLDSAITDAKVSLTNVFERVKNQTPLESYEINSAFPAKGSISEFDEKMGAIVSNYNSLW